MPKVTVGLRRCSSYENPYDLGAYINLDLNEGHVDFYCIDIE